MMLLIRFEIEFFRATLERECVCVCVLNGRFNDNANIIKERI